jgi:membrane protease YdiL (CAAX protease family)
MDFRVAIISLDRDGQGGEQTGFSASIPPLPRLYDKLHNISQGITFMSQSTPGTPSAATLRKQLLICATMCAIAATILVIWPVRSDAWRGACALSWFHQLLAGAALGLLYWAIAEAAYRFLPNGQGSQTVIDSYSELGLSGWRPLWISLAAGVGEELLFRGALQPHLGIWVTSALFALAHLRGYRIRELNRTTVAQLAGLFGVSVALGALAHFGGLVTAIVVHVMVDVAGLLIVRRAAARAISA